MGEHRKPSAGGRNPGFEKTWTTRQQSLCKGCSFPWQLVLWERGNAPPLDGCGRWPPDLPFWKSLQCQNGGCTATWKIYPNVPKLTSSSLSAGPNYLSGVPVQTVWISLWKYLVKVFQHKHWNSGPWIEGKLPLDCAHASTELFSARFCAHKTQFCVLSSQVSDWGSAESLGSSGWWPSSASWQWAQQDEARFDRV